MKMMLLGLAASAAALSTAAHAQQFAPSASSGGFRAENVGSVTIHRGDRWRGRGRVVFNGYREYQGDTLWRSDGFNDWWHDRPSRAYPKWISDGSCERLWWSGGGWRC